MFDSAKKIKNFVLISILFLISLFICFQNFKSGTYLSGWDTLQSEFNFGITFKRYFSPTFQDHQGLGAVSAQSHIADLPRVIILFIFSFIFSESFLRYSYVFLMLIIGPLGVYYFLKELLSNNSNEEDDYMLFPSFIGALFYLTNLSVVQHFNIPLEMFLTLFGYLGFIFLYVLRFLKDFSNKNLINLVIVSFLIAPSAHTATLFYMFLLILIIYLVGFIFAAEDRKVAARNSFYAVGIIVTVNLFWILPNIYFVLTHGTEVSNSKIHSLFSDQAYLSNLAFGNFFDISILKNYLFIWQIWNGQKFVSLLDTWAQNLDSGIEVFGYLVFFLAVFGIGAAVVKKEKKLYGFIVIFFLSAFFIASSNSLVGGVFDFLRNNVPFLKEALRFPFNKFSTLFSFSIAIFLAYFNYFIFSFSKREALKITTALFFTIFSLVYFLPAFRGNLINPLMRVNFNPDYFEVFNYFKTQEEFGRVADLPIHSVYGWSYFSFGYQGAGFLWFGIDKPLMNREFDRWQVKNEDYYNEMTWAVYNDNPQALEKVLNKYQIKWLLVDQNVFSPNDFREILHFDSLEKTLTRVSNLKMDKKIGANIYIYKYSPPEAFVRAQIVDKVSYLSNETFRENKDLTYLNLGNYYSDFSNEVSVGLKTSQDLINPNLISADSENFYLKNINNLTDTQVSFELSLSSKLLNIKSKDQNLNLTLPETTNIVIVAGNAVDFSTLKTINLSSDQEIILYQNQKSLFLKDLDSYFKIESCGEESLGSSYSLQRETNQYILNSSKITSCLNLDLKEFLKTQKAENYLIKFSALSQNSNSFICIYDSKNQCNKIKLNINNEFTFDSSATGLVIINEPTNNLEGKTIVSNLNLASLKFVQKQNLNLKINNTNEVSSLSIKKDSKFSGDMSVLGYHPRICQSQDLELKKVGVYESKDYNICDNVSFNYDSKNYYLVEIKSKNNSGLPLRMCLQNSKTYRCDLFLALPKNKEFKSDFILLPPFKDPHNLAITNQVIEGNTSSNEISYMSIKQIDYENIFNLKSENQQKIFVYNKAFDRGFIAFCGLLPCNFKHVLYNNWANGWVIPEGMDIAENSILIVFWPNYLAVLGLFGFIWAYLSAIKAIQKAKPTYSN